MTDSRKGLSLLEVVIALALVVVIILIAGAAMKEGSDGTKRKSTKFDMVSRARSILEEVTREIRRADPMTIKIEKTPGGTWMTLKTVEAISPTTGAPTISSVIIYGPTLHNDIYHLVRIMNGDSITLASDVEKFEITRKGREIGITLILVAPKPSPNATDPPLTHKVHTQITLRNP